MSITRRMFITALSALFLPVQKVLAGKSEYQTYIVEPSERLLKLIEDGAPNKFFVPIMISTYSPAEPLENGLPQVNLHFRNIWVKPDEVEEIITFFENQVHAYLPTATLERSCSGCENIVRNNQIHFPQIVINKESVLIRAKRILEEPEYKIWQKNYDEDLRERTKMEGALTWLGLWPRKDPLDIL